MTNGKSFCLLTSPFRLLLPFSTSRLPTSDHRSLATDQTLCYYPTASRSARLLLERRQQMTTPMNRPLAEADPEIAATIADEERRLAYNLEMIASENFVSEAVLEAMGSVLTNKYAEGYPGKRYYGGCEF